MPLPLPDEPAVTLSHDALLVALQVQPAVAVTVTLPFPPPAAVLALFGAIEYRHPAA